MDYIVTKDERVKFNVLNPVLENVESDYSESIKDDLKINRYQPTVGANGSELGEVFDMYMQEYGNSQFICSLAYTLGKIHGKREERARRKKAGVSA